MQSVLSYPYKMKQARHREAKRHFCGHGIAPFYNIFSFLFLYYLGLAGHGNKARYPRGREL